jgi:hypothetical protein
MALGPFILTYSTSAAVPGPYHTLLSLLRPRPPLEVLPVAGTGCLRPTSSSCLLGELEDQEVDLAVKVMLKWLCMACLRMRDIIVQFHVFCDLFEVKIV